MQVRADDHNFDSATVPWFHGPSVAFSTWSTHRPNANRLAVRPPGSTPRSRRQRTRQTTSRNRCGLDDRQTFWTWPLAQDSKTRSAIPLSSGAAMYHDRTARSCDVMRAGTTDVAPSLVRLGPMLSAWGMEGRCRSDEASPGSASPNSAGIPSVEFGAGDGRVADVLPLTIGCESCLSDARRQRLGLARKILSL